MKVRLKTRNLIRDEMKYGSTNLQILSTENSTLYIQGVPETCTFSLLLQAVERRAFSICRSVRKNTRFFIRNAHTDTVHRKRSVTLSTVQNIKIKQLDYFSAE